MSQPNNERVGSFVSDLVAMAKATERLPGLEAELQRMQTQAIEDGQRIARLERKLLDAKTHEEELNAKLRSVEAERDNAGFRELEATDREDNLKRVIRDCQIAMGEAMKALEPVTEARPTTGVDATDVGSTPTVAAGTGDGIEPFAPYLGEQPTPGQSDVDPTQAGEEKKPEPFQPARDHSPRSEPQEDGELNPRPIVPTTTGSESQTAVSLPVDGPESVGSTASEAREVPQSDPTVHSSNGKPSQFETVPTMPVDGEDAVSSGDEDLPKVASAARYSW